jgi:hypothetical protein
MSDGCSSVTCRCCRPASAFGACGVATWQDGQCREVMVGIYPDARFSSDGPRVGRWRVITDAPGKCYTVEPGRTGCLECQARFGSDLVTVQLLGISRPVGDPMVEEIS